MVILDPSLAEWITRYGLTEGQVREVWERAGEAVSRAVRAEGEAS